MRIRTLGTDEVWTCPNCGWDVTRQGETLPEIERDPICHTCRKKQAMDSQKPEPFCACGRVWSECDGSRALCAKNGGDPKLRRRKC